MCKERTNLKEQRTEHAHALALAHRTDRRAHITYCNITKWEQNAKKFKL